MMINKDTTYHSNLAIPPGEFLEEVLEDLGMSKDELAKRIDRPASKLSHIFKGEKAITTETALRLEKAVGVPAHIWTGLEAEYQLIKARQKEEEQLKQETEYITRFCYSDLVKIGEVQKKTKPIDKVRELLNFFGTSSLTTVSNLRYYQPAYRQGKSGEYTLDALAAWLRMGERQAQRVECQPFNKSKLKKCVDELRPLTFESPNDFEPKLEKILASCGVALVICPHFPKTKAHGATFQLRDDKVVLMITIRGRWADIFWFSLFHEIGHILKHSLKDIIIEDKDHDQREEEADQFASETVIPPRAYEEFIKEQNFTKHSIKSFARQINIHPGCVVGRLQHDKHIEHNFHNGLRTKYEWKK